jgi:hypothetical protein
VRNANVIMPYEISFFFLLSHHSRACPHIFAWIMLGEAKEETIVVGNPNLTPHLFAETLILSTMDMCAASCKSMTHPLHHAMSEPNVILYVTVSILVQWFAF